MLEPAHGLNTLDWFLYDNDLRHERVNTFVCAGLRLPMAMLVEQIK